MTPPCWCEHWLAGSACPSSFLEPFKLGCRIVYSLLQAWHLLTSAILCWNAETAWDIASMRFDLQDTIWQWWDMLSLVKLSFGFPCNRCSRDDSKRAGRWIECQFGTFSRETWPANRPEYWHTCCALGHHPHRWGRVAKGGLESRGLSTWNFSAYWHPFISWHFWIFTKSWKPPNCGSGATEKTTLMSLRAR